MPGKCVDGWYASGSQGVVDGRQQTKVEKEFEVSRRQLSERENLSQRQEKLVKMLVHREILPPTVTSAVGALRWMWYTSKQNDGTSRLYRP